MFEISHIIKSIKKYLFNEYHCFIIYKYFFLCMVKLDPPYDNYVASSSEYGITHLTVDTGSA
ncbi:hypothetical protein Avbf_17206 [Armadillidium vulgare]|nr:hypothetical protein Avbf_17206 [Armadillidium vulgare]